MRALITGITGQDGSYLAELLLSKGYEVHGFLRKSSTGNTANIDHIIDRIKLHRGDVTDANSLLKAIESSNPDEIYNEADLDHVGWSWSNPEYAYRVTGITPLTILGAIRGSRTKFLQPISSNIFGKTSVSPQDENTPHNPQSPYACAKSLAFHTVRMFRELGVFASTAILYNHESIRRTDDYVTRKITKAVANIVLGRQSELILGDVTAEIDWGWSEDYVEAEYAILQNKFPGDFIIATGETHSVYEFAKEAFSVVGLEVDKYLKTSPEHSRPTKNSRLAGDTTKALEVLGFTAKHRFRDIVRIMVENDIKQAQRV